MQETMTFNDLPKVVSQVLAKVERMERVLDFIKDEVCKKRSSSAEHTPMTIDEACEFLKMKKSTMYYHIERDNIPATKRGKNYILFKDELVSWLESGRKSSVPLTPEEMNAQKLSSIKRKPRRFGNWSTNGIYTLLYLLTDQCHVTVIGKLCDVFTGEGKSVQTHLLLFRSYTTEPLIQWHSHGTVKDITLSVRNRHDSTIDSFISPQIILQKNH